MTNRTIERASAADLLARAAAGLLAAGWIAVFGLLLAGTFRHAPAVAALGIAWAVLGATAPSPYLCTLVAAIPFFGNNPGGPHHLYLLDLGLMGFVAGRLVARAVRRGGPASATASSFPSAAPSTPPPPLRRLIRFFLFVSAFGLIAVRLHLQCEAAITGGDFLHSIYTHYSGAQMFGLRAWLDLALSIALAGALADAPPPIAWRRRVAASFAGGMVAASILGMLDYAGALSLEWWRPSNLYITRFGYRRLQSLYWHSGWFAQPVSVAAAWALAAAVVGGWSRSRFGRIAAGGAFGVLAFAQLLTMQRGGWLALGAGSLAVAGLAFATSGSRETRRRMLARGAAAAGLAAVAVAGLAAVNAPFRARLGEMAAFRDRSTIWRGAVGMIARYPLTGVGMGNYHFTHLVLYTPETPESLADDRTTAHQTTLHLAAERGVFAAGLHLAIVAAALLATWRAARGSRVEGDETPAAAEPPGPDPEPAPDPDAAWRRVEALAVFGALIALLVDGLFQYIFYLRVTELLFWMHVGAALAWAGGAGRFGADPGRAADRSPSRGALGRIGSARATSLALALSLACVLLWGNRDRLGGWKFYAGGQVFRIGGAEVAIPLPSGSADAPPGDPRRRVILPVFSLDPCMSRGEEVVFSAWIGDRLMGVKRFREPRAQEFEFETPPGAPPDARVVVRASRTWRPFEHTSRVIPVLEAGVCHAAPRAGPSGG